MIDDHILPGIFLLIILFQEKQKQKGNTKGDKSIFRAKDYFQ